MRLPLPEPKPARSTAKIYPYTANLPTNIIMIMMMMMMMIIFEVKVNLKPLRAPYGGCRFRRTVNLRTNLVDFRGSDSSIL